jgi:hypothetical protein
VGLGVGVGRVGVPAGDGLAVGALVGVGRAEGAGLGFGVGVCVGAAVGEALGGATVGEGIGVRVAVGAAVACGVGVGESAAVLGVGVAGAVVGAGVLDAVGAAEVAPCGVALLEGAGVAAFIGATGPAPPPLHATESSATKTDAEIRRAPRKNVTGFLFCAAWQSPACLHRQNAKIQPREATLRSLTGGLNRAARRPLRGTR